jgi:molecular chaperone GrpE
MTDSLPQDERTVEDEVATEEEGAIDESGDATAGGDDPHAGAGEEDDADGVGALEGQDRVATLDRDLEELNDRHLRLVAEFNNFRRRTEQERLGAWARAQADIMAKFLDVLDDLNRVAQLDLSNATVEAIMEGVDLVERKFVRMLEDSGVEVIDPEGEGFDPERMEAMMRVPVDSEQRDDVVAQVFQKGYSLKGVLIRPARVSVYKHG